MLSVDMPLSQYSMEIIDPEVFTIDEVLDIFKKITTSKTGWLRYHDVLLSLGGGEIGKKKINKLIERNILLFRPSSGFSRDMTPTPEEAVLAAQGQPTVRG